MSLRSRLGILAEFDFRQLFIAWDGLSGLALERHAFILRKRIEHEVPVPASDSN